MYYDSKLATLNENLDPDTLNYNYWWSPSGGGTWNLGIPTLATTAVDFGPSSGVTDRNCYAVFVLTLGDGSQHNFANQAVCAGYTTQLGTFSYPRLNIPVTDSQDASFIRLDTTNASDIVAHLKDGTQIHFNMNLQIAKTIPSTLAQGPFKILDNEGNAITFIWNANGASITDTVGRTITLASSSNGTSTTISYKDSNGNSQSILLAYSSFAYSYTANLPANSGPGPGSFQQLSSITLPTGLSYTFQYNSTVGELSKITYPTGGYTRYDFGTFTNYWVFSGDQSANTPADFRELTARHVCRSALGSCSSEDTTTYSPTIDSTQTSNQYMNVVDAANNLTRFQFTFGTGSVPFATGREITRWSYTGPTATPSALLRTVQTDYDQGTTTTSNSLPIRVTTTLNDSGQVAKEELDYDSYTATAHSPGDPFGSVHTFSQHIDNVIEKREYDFGSGSPGSLRRRTDYTWLKTNPVNAQDYTTTAIRILNRKTSQIVYDSASNQCRGLSQACSQVTYEYDNYAATGGMNASGAVQHDPGFSTSYTTRGNVTTIKRWRNTDGAWLAATNQYDDAGNVIQVKDPLLHPMTFSYADSWGNNTCAPSGGSAAAYATSVTDAAGHVARSTYNSCSGAVASTTDVNSQATTLTYDAMGRTIQANSPGGGQTTKCYSDTSGSTCYSASKPLKIVSTQKITASISAMATDVLDGLAREAQHQLNSDPQGTVFTDTTYDALGRIATVSNPYRTGTDITSSPGTTTYAYDALGRKMSETYPDGSATTTSYSGNTVTVSDATGKARKSATDGLGRLIQVTEDPGGLGYVTTYTYDALNNLLTVAQNGSHQRNFTYDSLSHLLTSTNPEVGTITYTYDNDGNLATKKDARSITTTYGYDVLNRETTRTYSNGDPSVTTTYDQSACLGLASCQNIGHRTSMTDAAGSEAWAYDVPDRIHKEQRTTNSITKSATYYADLAGNLTSVVYPTSRTVNYTYDAANRPSTAADGSNGITYATDFQTAPAGCLTGKVCYTPQGTFYALSIGQSTSFTGLNLSHSYNSRLQPQEFKASSTGGNAIDITYSFVDPVTSHNAGHVYSITNNLDTTRSQTFAYDSLNRITSALTTSTHATSSVHCWGETFSVDAWGNLQSIAATTNSNYTGCSQESGFTKTADGNNHLSGFTYDPSGNTLTDGANTYVWDGESQLKSAAGVNYLYDGDGRRVSKSSGKLYWYGSGGDILAETDAAGNTTAEYIFFGGKRIAMLPASGTPIYYVEDLLGTSRVTTTNTGAVCYDADFYPYGGERSYTNTCPQNYKFEGKERDSETGNDDFGARYYSNRFGRWLSADWSAIPIPVPYANLSNPQTLNLYAMVSDDPESFADLDGHMEVAVPAALGGSFVLPSWAGIDSAQKLGDDEFAKINAQIEADEEKARQNSQSQQQQNQNQGENQPNQPQQPDPNKPTQPQPETPKPPSWDPKKPLPGDPKDLGPDWQRDPGHRAPNDERYVNPNGDKLDWHKGRPDGKGKWDKRDHWHWNEHDWHFRPGDTVKRTAILITAGVVAYWVISEASRLFPPRNLVPAP
jgi:RHS repeat-associated protein